MKIRLNEVQQCQKIENKRTTKILFWPGVVKKQPKIPPTAENIPRRTAAGGTKTFGDFSSQSDNLACSDFLAIQSEKIISSRSFILATARTLIALSCTYIIIS